MQPNKDNLIVNLTFQFSLDIIEYAELLESKRKFVFANQILKAGTAIGASVHEAQNAESKNDFIHKMKISAKEAEEIEYWLLLCKFAKNYPPSDMLLEQLKSIMNVLNKIISSSKGKS